MSKEIFNIPTFCPLGCGKTLTIQKISGPCKEYMKNTRQISKVAIDWENSYGVLCSKCGYATVILPEKED